MCRDRPFLCGPAWRFSRDESRRHGSYDRRNGLGARLWLRLLWSISWKQIQDELVQNTYQPMPVRKKEIPKEGSTKVRVLSIPAIRDRVVQGALKLILEPIFEADFQSGSYGYRPKRSAHEAVDRVDQAIVQGLTRIIDLDLRAYFDSVQHSLLLAKVARRVQDASVMGLRSTMVVPTATESPGYQEWSYLRFANSWAVVLNRPSEPSGSSGTA